MRVNGQVWKIEYKRLDRQTLDVKIVVDYVTSDVKPTRLQEKRTLDQFSGKGRYEILENFVATPIGHVI